MKKYLLSLAAVLCTAMSMTVLTSCTEQEDNPSIGTSPDSAIVGNWICDITNRSYPLWNIGQALHMMTFRADGTGYFETFYTLQDDLPLGRDYQTFTYTTTSDGHLTMEMEDGTFPYTYQVAGGQLTLDYGGGARIYEKADATTVDKYAEWDQRELITVPNAARYTVFVYGNAGGYMDYIIEDGFWERMKPLLTDSLNVRVVCFYKYGQDLPEQGKAFTGKYADPGDIVWFELNSKTDLERLREEGFASHGLAEQAKSLKLCDPTSLKAFIQLSSLFCPAEEYIFSIWGHGTGFNPTMDVPGKYEEDEPTTRGVIADEWNDKEQLDMYELAQAIRECGAVGRMNTIFFHNCLMGNMESLTELKDVTDYICCSAHVLTSDGIVLSEFVQGLMEQDNTEDAVKQMFQRMRPEWDDQYPHDIKEGENLPNGDFKMLRTSQFDGVLDASRRLATRLVELFPAQRDAILQATRKVYRFLWIDYNNPDMSPTVPFFDLADFAHKLAEETGDATLAAIAADMDQAFDELFIHSADVNWNEQHLDHYTLSVCIYHNYYYNADLIGNGASYLANIGEGYEQCAFHKLTGWGNYLRINDILPFDNPASQGGGPLIK